MKYSEQYYERKLEIENGLLELMQVKTLQEITVKDIAAHLHFVRKTFYHYFPNKMACLESLTDRIIYECNLHSMRTLPQSPSLYAQYTAQLQYWISQKPFLDAIIENKLSSFFAERIILYLCREYPDLLNQMHTANVACDEDILFFYITGEISLLLKWCAEGFSLSIEEMAAKKVRLVHEPLLPIPSEK